MENGPAWSVIVPTYNRPERLADCVRGLAALRPPDGGFEIIIVNDGGVAPPPAVHAAAVAGNALYAHFLTRPNGGPAGARNDGAARARGRRLAFTDDDCVPDSDWLLALDAALDRAPDALVGGAVLNALTDNVYSEASQVLAEYVMEYFDGEGRERFFTSNNIALARDAFHDVGGFDGSFGLSAGEDREFCDRWHAAGRRSLRVPGAVIRHAHALDLRSYLRQHFAYGAGALSFRAVREDAGRPVGIDPGFYTGSLRHAWRGRPLLRGAAMAAWTAVAHAAYMTGLATAVLRARGSLATSNGSGPLR